MNTVKEVIFATDTFRLEKHTPEEEKFPNGATTVYKVEKSNNESSCEVNIFACEYDGNNLNNIKGKIIEKSSLYIASYTGNYSRCFNTATLYQAVEYVENCEKAIDFYERVMTYLSSMGFIDESSL